MKQYKTDFKLEVVQSFLAGEGGAKLLARLWSVPEEKIWTWVSHYRLHGVDGLRPKCSAYSSEFKLQVLSHQDREQLSSRQVAAIYDTRNPNQVVVWRHKLNQGGLETFTNSKQVHPKMKPELLAGLRPHHKVTDLLQVAGLARSTFYYHCQATQCTDQQRAMEARIRVRLQRAQGPLWIQTNHGSAVQLNGRTG